MAGVSDAAAGVSKAVASGDGVYSAPDGGEPAPLGRPRRHHRRTGSTNAEAATLAAAGAPHGTLVTSSEQTAGRGRQGRSWVAPAGEALMLSLVLRRYDDLLPLRAGLAVAEVAGRTAGVKWPNDVLLDGRKVAGILVEAFPRRGWAVLGVGINVAIDVAALPAGLRDRAGSLGRPVGDVEIVLAELLSRLPHRLAEAPVVILDSWRRRDALLGREVTWAGGSGVATGVDARGSLQVISATGETIALHAGEVHLLS